MDSREFLRQWFDAHKKQLTMRQASLDIGRSHSYVQQYIERGVPQQLGEDDRKALARRLDVDEANLKDVAPRHRPDPRPATVNFANKTPTVEGPRDVPLLDLFEFCRLLPVTDQKKALRLLKATFGDEATSA